MLIVVERRETFHYYYPMGVHPPGDLTVTVEELRKTSACTVSGAFGNEFVKMISLIFLNLTNRLKRNLLEPRVCIYP